MATFFSYLKKHKIPSRTSLQRLFARPLSRYGLVLLTVLCAFFISVYISLASLSNHFMMTIPKRGGSLIEGVVGAPRFINPVLAATTTDRDLSQLVYAGLMKKDTSGALVPDIAESYSVSDDGKTYTFILREKLVFSNGMPLTMDDILFTFTKLQNPAIDSFDSAYWSVLSMQAKDARTLVITLPAKDDSFLEHMRVGIIAKAQWEGISDEDFPSKNEAVSALGAGPFVIQKVSQENGVIETISLKRNKRYHSTKPLLAHIKIAFFANQSLLSRALSRGAVDFTFGLSPAQSTSFSNARFVTQKIPTDGTIGLFRSSTEPLLADTRFVAILDRFVDRNEIIATVQSGYGISPTDATPLTMSEALAALKPLGYEYREGTLEKKGTPVGFSIAVENDETMLASARALAEQLGTLGIIVTIQAYDHGTFRESMRTREYSIFIASTTTVQSTYQLLLPLYTRATPFVANIDTHIDTGKRLDTIGDRYAGVATWYRYTQRIWNIFNNKK